MQDVAGVWFCLGCCREYEPYLLGDGVVARGYTGTDCPKTDRPHRAAGGRCLDCRELVE
jgi:hypothetical protein